MATTFKPFTNNDIATTRTLLHESIPVTGTIISGTYADNNIKNYAHGMFQSVYDYPYLSSSANHIFDITVGVSSLSDMNVANQQTKKQNIYNQMAQTLVPYDISGNIQSFDQDGDILAGGYKWYEALFFNFSRLLVKDEIKKGEFTMIIHTGGLPSAVSDELTIGDYGASSSFKVNTPIGEYGLLYTGSDDAGDGSKAVGHLYYQAGIAVITPYIFSDNFLVSGSVTEGCEFGAPEGTYDTSSFQAVLTGATIQDFADGVRNRVKNIQFTNTTELNSTIYFCRANTGEYNYSSNPTYLSESKILVKGNNEFAEPKSFITTVGLYSANNELLAVAKLSEPLKKTPSNEVTLRVRLDY